MPGCHPRHVINSHGEESAAYGLQGARQIPMHHGSPFMGFDGSRHPIREPHLTDQSSMFTCRMFWIEYPSSADGLQEGLQNEIGPQTPKILSSQLKQ